MKKFYALFILALLAIMPNTAKAQLDEGIYAGVLGAANWAKNHEHYHYKSGYFVAGALGYRTCLCETWVRGEVEFGYRHNKAHWGFEEDPVLSEDTDESGSLRTWSVMGNAYLDFDTCWCVAPYIGAGIGWSDTKRDVGDERKEHGFAYQLIAGAAYPVMECADLFIEYRYFKPSFKKAQDQNVGAGLRFFF